MIPILYHASETAFTTEGIGRLSDCLSCLVTEVRNGIYECEFTYPITGVLFDQIEEGMIISVDHDDKGDRQPFIVYRHDKPLNGVCTFYAHHISYKLSSIILKPMTATSVASAFAQFETNTLGDNPFTFWTNKATGGNFTLEKPAAVKTMLGGTRGSILDSFGGGDYEFDKFTVRLYQDRGTDNGVVIRYGKNLAGLDSTYDTLDMYNAVVPFWENAEGDTVVYGGVVYADAGARIEEYWTIQTGEIMTDENDESFTFDYSPLAVVPMDLSSEFEDQPTVAELEARAAEIMNDNQPWLPEESITVDFVALWQTEEYASIAPLERVSLCDTVRVTYTALGVDVKTKVVKTVWNALLDRYDSIELGTVKTSFADAVMGDTQERLDETPTISMMETVIDHATALITGGMGGHVLFVYDADGKPTEILIMDTEDAATAVHVLRINLNGIGFSSNGINGPYDTAWTLDGNFVADFITAGTMQANRIKGGTLTLGGALNGNGVLIVLDANGNEIGRWNNDGITLEKGTIQGPSITLGGYLNGNGRLEVLDASSNQVILLNNQGISLLKGNINLANNFIATTAGAVTAKSFTANDYIYVDGNNTSYFKIPSYNASQGIDQYLELSSDGFLVNSILSSTRHRVAMGGAYLDGSTRRSTEGGIVLIKGNGSGSGNNCVKFTSAKLDAYSSNATYITQLLYQGNGNDGFYVKRLSDSKQSYMRYNAIGCSGTKSRIVTTEDYGIRKLYCYETPSPLFGDIGEGVIGEDGSCYVMIDSVFAETVTLYQYQVFLQKYGDGECYVIDRKAGHFVVCGTPGLPFGWEIKAKQSDYDQLRFEVEDDPVDITTMDYGDEAATYIDNLKEGRIPA